MSAPIDNGGPAFPIPGETWESEGMRFANNPHYGMPLRDYFAAKSMQGLIAATGDSNGAVIYDSKTVAASAYEMADAMLKAREQ